MADPSEKMCSKPRFRHLDFDDDNLDLRALLTPHIRSARASGYVHDADPVADPVADSYIINIT